MSRPEEEHAFWEGKASTLNSAVEAIAADESAWSGAVLEKCLDQILPALDAAPHRKDHGPRVLDLGCGAGRLTIPIAERRPKFEMVGVDISQNMLDFATIRAGIEYLDLNREKLRIIGPEAASRVAVGKIRWIPCDGRSLPADVGRLDAAYSMIMLQHIPRGAQARYIREVADLLVRGGVFRFQGLEGEESTFLHHYITEAWVQEVGESSGLKVTAVDRLRPFNDNPDAPNALWVTAVKR